MFKKILLLLAACMATVSGFGFETAQTVTATPITTVPYTINTPGNYYLSAGLAAPGNDNWAIIITANNVTLDLNGSDLLGVPGSTDYGIYVNGTSNVTIKNGSLNETPANGNGAPAYVYGIVLLNAVNTTIDNIQIVSAIYPIVDTSGVGNQVKNCTINTSAFGIIFSACSGCVASDNILTGVNLYALLTQSSLGCLFKNNTVHYSAGVPGMILGSMDQYSGNSFLGFPPGTPVIFGGVNIAGQ